MEDIKKQIIDNICYTELVYGRINKKLSTDLTKPQIESLILETLNQTDATNYIKSGKNYYISNADKNICITVNSYTYRVITVNRLEKCKV